MKGNNIIKSKIRVVFISISTISLLIFGCIKKNEINNTRYQQDESFFLRNSDWSSLFSTINKRSTDVITLNRSISQLREIDKSNRIVEKIKVKYGIALWDLSLVIKNADGSDAIMIPLSKGDSIVAIIVGFENKIKHRVTYKIIEKNNPQNKLPVYGDKYAKSITRETIKGLFNFLSNTLQNLRYRQTGLTSSAITVTWYCWNYHFSYLSANGDVLVGTTIPQCTFSISEDGVTSYEYLEPPSQEYGASWVWNYNSAPSPNQHIIDSLNGYPCAQNVLAQMPACNDQIKSILSDVFGVNAEVNIKFAVNSNLHDTVIGQERVANGSLTNYMSVIELNPRYLSGSQDYIASTLIHEAIHSYISYQRRNLDSTTFKTLFPIYWENRGNDAQHNEMATNYLNVIKNFIKGINGLIQDDVAEALAWGGLQKTNLWNSKSSTDKIDIMNINYRCANPTQGTADSLKLKKCL